MAFQPVFGKTFPNVFPTASSGDWWNLYGVIPKANCIAAYRAKGAASQAASYVNLVTPGTYDCTTTSAPTFSATEGWDFGPSTNKFLNTGVVIGATTWSIIARIYVDSDGGASFGRVVQSNDATNTLLIIVRISDGATSTRIFQYGGTTNTAKNGASSGAHVVAMAGTTGYFDGVSQGAITSGTLPTGSLYIGNNAAVNRSFGGHILALAIYNSDQSANMAALYTAIAAL